MTNDNYVEFDIEVDDSELIGEIDIEPSETVLFEEEIIGQPKKRINEENVPVPKTHMSQKTKSRIVNIIIYAVLIIMCFIWIIPFVGILLESFRTESTGLAGYIIPKEWGFDNYIRLFTETQFPKWFLNTFIMGIITAVVQTAFVLAVAYALSRNRFKGRKFLMNLMLVFSMFPGFLTLILLYTWMNDWNLTDANAPWGLIIIYVASSGMGYYLGHTVNFKSYKKSYKSKKRNKIAKEDWLIFENTQEAIIDQATFDTVQKLRNGKRRPRTDLGEMSPLSGMLYCADCGKKMYLCRCTTMKQSEYFNCSSYRKQKKRTCTSHQITVKAVTEMILDDLRFTVNYAKEYKQQFYQMVEKTADTATKKELSSFIKEIDEAEKRIKSLDKIIQSLYEDKVEEKISEERYLKLSELYESEQKELTDRVKTLKAEVERAKAKKNDIQKFMALVNKYSDFEELTPDILRAFIDKVYIHEKTKVDGHYHQTIEIVYNFIGATEPSWFAKSSTRQSFRRTKAKTATKNEIV